MHVALNAAAQLCSGHTHLIEFPHDDLHSGEVGERTVIVAAAERKN
jgi:hypothetical protein